MSDVNQMKGGLGDLFRALMFISLSGAVLCQVLGQ